MSRSLKKRPVVKDSVPRAKKKANRRVREYEDDISNGNSYRKLTDSWDISEYAFYRTKNRYRRECEEGIKHALNGVFVAQNLSRVNMKEVPKVESYEDLNALIDYKEWKKDYFGK